MYYKIAVSDLKEYYLKLEWTIDHIRQDTVHIQLPAWRPGRYELQNYARNLRNFYITDGQGNPVNFHKTHKDRWEIETHGIHQLLVSYEYYANQLDAGASFVNSEFIYINPVNCLMYAEGRMDEEYTIELSMPDHYDIACQLPVNKQLITAKNFDELADSPFIASATMHHFSFDINSFSSKHQDKVSSKIHFWFQGAPYSDMDKMIAETKAYCNEQVALFGEIPSKDYHFLYHILPVNFRHGVEHLNSTVIAMGPPEDWNKQEFYDSFMAISSHELFHLWNVKRIRPADMLPYDFTKENYSTLGYVYEGVTTYYGDIILLRSGVWTWEQYTTSLNADLLKHLSNNGRFNYSVAESSFDTWLDGYVQGTPGRKVSIYTEGMLAAFIADIIIIKNTQGKYSLDDIMRDLYHDFYKQGKGYTEADYKKLLEKYAGESFDRYFNELIRGKGFWEKWLSNTAETIGCEVDLTNGRMIKKANMSDRQALLFNAWSRSRLAAE